MPAPFPQPADVTAMLNEVGVTVTLGATTGKGLLRRTDVVMLNGEAVRIAGLRAVVNVETGFFAGLVEGASITVDGTTYKVLQQHRFVSNAALTQVLLAVP